MKNMIACIVDVETINPCKLLTSSELQHKSFISSQNVRQKHFKYYQNLLTY